MAGRPWVLNTEPLGQPPDVQRRRRNVKRRPAVQAGVALGGG